jgi:hypothetical protein
MKLEKCKKRILPASIVPKVYINRKKLSINFCGFAVVAIRYQLISTLLMKLLQN